MNGYSDETMQGPKGAQKETQGRAQKQSPQVTLVDVEKTVSDLNRSRHVRAICISRGNAMRIKSASRAF